MKHLVLTRSKSTKTETIGTIWEGANVICKTLELPWKENKRGISCIPAGTYKIVPRETKKYGKHILIKNVENRTAILIHAGNWTTETRGCILTGTTLATSNKGLKTVQSKIALKKLTETITEEATLTII